MPHPRRLASRPALAGLAATLTLGAAPAAAQDSAVRNAADAFGERVGIEQLGLYNEGEVRGFSLQASGSYRIDDAYFSPAAPLNDPLLAGVSVRLGANAANLAYPAPSGVVNYRLRAPAARDFLSVAAGVRDYGTRALELNGSWRAFGEEGGVAGGLVWRPTSHWRTGARGRAYDAGLVIDRTFADIHRLRLLGSVYHRDYDSDDAVQALDGRLPPQEHHLRNHAPEWARLRATNVNLGGLYALRSGPWRVDASAFRSIYDADREDFTVIQTRAGAPATGATYVGGPRRNVSDTAEARIARALGAGEVRHIVGASVRARRSEVERTSVVAVPIAPFPLDGEPIDPAQPAWSGTRGGDRVRQLTGSLSYGLDLGDRLQVRTALHRTRYEKTVDTLPGGRTRGVDQRTLANVSVIQDLDGRTSLFGSWVTGLEESGVAPQTATNRDEVLPPALAEQFELGVRHRLTPQLTVLAAAFEITKPTVGFQPDGRFGFVGQVRHRGVEASLAGRLHDGTQVVVGAVRFQPRISGPLVDAGQVGSRPAGVSATVANASVERPLGRGWSGDAQLSYAGPRWVDARNTLRAPGFATLNLGLRRGFRIDDHAAQLRVLASNVTGETRWAANAAGLLYPVSPRTIRAMLTVTLERGPTP